MTTGALSIMMLCPECVSVMCTAPGTSVASSFCGRRARSVHDRSDVPRRVRRQLTGLDELRDDIDELVAGREHDDRHGPRRCRGGRLVQGLIEILPFQIG